MVEDVRGRYESEGEFEPLTQEPADGDDTLNWMARQPWCDGKIGMTGGSYLGIVQWKAALRANPHLKAIFTVVAGDDDYRDRFYSTGGAMKLGNRLEWMAENLKTPGYHPDFNHFVWHLPLLTADVAATGRVSSMYQQAVAHPAFDDFWQSISTREHLDQMRVPVFAVGGLYDNFAESDLDAFAALHKRSGLNHVLIGPWPHNMSAKFADVGFRPRVRGSGAPPDDRLVRPVAERQGHAHRLHARRCAFSSWARTSGWTSANGRPSAHGPAVFTWSAKAAPTRRRAMARWKMRRRAAPPPTASPSIRTTRSPRAAARSAATRTFSPGVRWTSAPSSSAATCWSSPRVRLNRISKWWDR